MTKALPRKYFPSHIARIYYRKLDKWAKMWAEQGVQPYFDTWDEARDYMIETTEKKIKYLERDLASAKRHLSKVKALQQ